MLMKALSTLTFSLALLVSGSHAAATLKPVKIGRTLFTGSYTTGVQESVLEYTLTSTPPGGSASTAWEGSFTITGPKATPPVLRLAIHTDSLPDPASANPAFANNPFLLSETYTFAAFDNAGADLGKLATAALYPNPGGSTITAPGLVTHAITTGATGFFKSVKQIQITFNADNTRDILFLSA